MTGIFRTKSPLSTPLLLMYGLLIKLPYIFVHPTISRSPSDGLLFGYIADAFELIRKEWPVALGLFIFLLLFVQAIGINYYVNNSKMVERTTYLPAMIYLLLTSFFPEWNVLSAALIVNTLIVWIFGRLLLLPKVKQAKPVLFNIGLCIGISSFFYFPSIALAMLVVFSLIVARPPQASEWVILFLGLLVPWYLLFSWLFLTDGLDQFTPVLFYVSIPEIKWTIDHYVFIGLLAIVFLWGTILEQMSRLKHMIQIRRSWFITILGAIALLLAPLLSTNADLSNWLIALVFVAPLAGYGFYYTSYHRLSLIVHWIAVGFVIYFQYFD